MRRFILSMPLLILAIPARAQAPDAPTIIVTGAGLALPPGTPAYGSVIIDRDRLTGGASNRIEGVLGDVAGFQQFRRSDSRSSNPSSQGATLRALGGNASSRTLVLLDGVPVADPFFGYIPFVALAPDRLSMARVTRGGGSGAFGAGAVAGTIELVSATRDQLPLFAASAFHGGRGASELSASVSPDLGGGYVTLSGRRDRGEGFQTTPGDQRVAATVAAAYDDWSASLRAVAPLSATSELQLRGALFGDRRTLRFRGADSHSEGQDASIRYIARGPWQVDALAYIQARNFSNIVIASSPPFRKSLDQRNTPSTGMGGKIELRPPVGDGHVLRIGVDVRFASGDMFEDAYNANDAANPVTARRHAGGEQATAGLFMEHDWTVGPLVLTGGVRADHWTIDNGFYRATNAAGATTREDIYADRSDWRFSGRGGAILHPRDGVALRAAAYTGFRLPTLNELYRPFTVFPVTTRANAALLPEKLKGVEAGIDLTPLPGVALSATIFRNRLADAIANVTIDAVTRQRRNVDAIVVNGVELTASGRAGAIGLSASYAYSHARVHAPDAAFDGFVPAQSPRHAASATVTWQARRADTRPAPALSATIRYVSAQYEDDLQTDRLPDALTVDATVRAPLRPGLMLVARAENLFDATVVTRNAGGSMDLGTPRTFWIGVTLGR